MGVLPLQFAAGESAVSLGLSGREILTVRGLERGITPGQDVHVDAVREDGTAVTFAARLRVDGPAEVEYMANGGILPMVLRHMLED